MGVGVSGEFSHCGNLYQKVIEDSLLHGPSHGEVKHPEINILWTYKGEINEKK